jgi:hypothetical protein
VIDEIARVTLPGRISAVHCMDIPTGNTGLDHLRDFPGDLIRLHQATNIPKLLNHHHFLYIYN